MSLTRFKKQSLKDKYLAAEAQAAEVPAEAPKAEAKVGIKRTKKHK